MIAASERVLLAAEECARIAGPYVIGASRREILDEILAGGPVDRGEGGAWMLTWSRKDYGPICGRLLMATPWNRPTPVVGLDYHPHKSNGPDAVEPGYHWDFYCDPKYRLPQEYLDDEEAFDLFCQVVGVQFAQQDLV